MTLRCYKANIVEHDYLLATTQIINTAANRSTKAPIINPITAPMENSSSDSLTTGVTVGDDVTDAVVGCTKIVGVGLMNTRRGETVSTTTKC